MDKKVTVLTPNSRRQNVKVTPNTTLLEILEEVSQKHGLDSDEYCLVHHNREVSLTQMFRFSGLPNNCLLEMSKIERKRVSVDVDVCIQLEEGTRAQAQFKPTDSLWHVINKLHGDKVASYNSPIVIYMRKEIVGKQNIEATTLKSLGITTGRAMLRLINKNPEDLKTQANVYVQPVIKEQTPKDTEPMNIKRSNVNERAAGQVGGFAITKELVKSLKKDASKVIENDKDKKHTNATEKTPEIAEKRKYDWSTGTGRIMQSSSITLTIQPTEHEEIEIEPEIHIIGDRNAILYSLDTTNKKMEDLPDSFYDLTVNDLKLVLRDLKKISSGNSDAPLLTSKLRELEQSKTMLNKIAQYKSCIIRVQFPDRYVLQGTFKPIDTLNDVQEFVQKFLHQAHAKFHLCMNELLSIFSDLMHTYFLDTIPPKRILPLDKTLLEIDFVPTALVHFAFDEELDMPVDNVEEQLFVRREFLENLTTFEGALYAANKFRQLTSKAQKKGLDLPSSETDNLPDTSTGAIPKRRSS